MRRQLSQFGVVASRKKAEYLIKKQTDDVLVKFAVSYTRVSTGKQTKEWKTGINRQEKAWIKWLEEHPEYTPWDRKFVDLGVSGRGKNRTEGALFQFLEKARADEFPPETCLVIESVSRFTRDNVFDGLKLCIEIFELGHRLAFPQWGSPLDILVNPYGSSYAAGNVEIRAMSSLDIGIRHPESFAVMKDALTA